MKMIQSWPSRSNSCRELSFLSVALKELGLISEFNNGNITFEQLVSAQWELNSKYWKIHSEEVVELVD
jgi:hypothetical protein